MPCVGVLGPVGTFDTPFGISDLAPRRGLSLCLPCYPTGCCSCLIICGWVSVDASVSPYQPESHHSIPQAAQGAWSPYNPDHGSCLSHD